MTIILFIFLILTCINMKIAGENQYFHDYMDYDKTASIKGIFVILVIFRHYVQYINLDGPFDGFMKYLNGQMGQSLVAMFLFYSGYGIMLSIRRKGTDYVKKIPSKVLTLWIHYMIAVLCFLGVNLVIHNPIDLKKFLLTLVCWESIGNSNWYVMTIIVLYLLTFVAFWVFKKNHVISAIVLLLLSIGYVWFIKDYRPNYYYNTALCYPMGVLFALFKEKLDTYATKNDIYYYGFLLITFSMYYMAYIRRVNNIWNYLGWTMAFSVLCVVFTMKIQIDNSFLRFLGSHVFSIYILQRLPMYFISKTRHMNEHTCLYFGICFICTLFISLIFDKVMNKLDKHVIPH